MVSRVDEWRQARACATRPEFEGQHPYCFLVSAPSLRTGEFTVPAKSTKPIDFHTQVHGRGALTQPSIAPEEPLVMPLRKAPTNPFPDRISIGRATNCDIVIRDPSVSKLHGHFRDVTVDSAVFTDARSSNGTRIDGSAAMPGIAIEIRRHSLVVLGRVRLQLLTAADVYDWL